ncbi:T9SS type A sorting domain-containing protein [Taibaiella lutea]|uniref:T9SS type A sorting domain-containing protein n=1 Tax=Taibaiella lutea TaxID=2608001 RepID=A0A5M6CND8_9BACT|nr:T9SS type A sorting domain-containing protein [Taibaiella lutea]KAA5536577.1 T9SS type A sorting domain-containing protein [Taibaiella lutea]
MKKTLLLGGLLLSAWFSQAQQRLALYEEFTGENCPPCASTNPGLWTLISTPGNETKVLMLKYQSPIPSAGPIYNANPIFTDNRIDYYSISSAPSGSMNGGTPAHPGNLTQANINTASNGTAAFTISVGNPMYQNGGQTFTATITVTATAATNIANLKLRSALAESLHYATAPGTNGENDFENVIRQMYDNNGPNPDGQTIDAMWTAGQTRMYTIKGSVPSYVGVNPSTPPVNFLAAWVQRDDTKEVLQAARTPGNITITKPPLDIALTAISGVSGLKCQVPATITPKVTVKNTGTTPLTSATFYQNGGTGVMKTFPTIAAGASAEVQLDAIQIPNAGIQAVVDSVGFPNGVTNTDLNYYDNTVRGAAYILNSTAAPLPISYDFEAANAEWVPWPGTAANGFPILRQKAATQSNPNFGYGNSAYVGVFLTPYLSQADNGYLIFPKAELPAGPKAIDFYIAYALRGTIGDKLELLYTTDCGTNWTSVWTKSNGDLASAPATATNMYFIPSNDAGWKKWSVDITNVPTGANFAFKATSGDGSYIFIDNIKMRTGTTGINELIADGSFKVFPNPVSDLLNVSIDLKKASSVTYTVFSVLGQQVNAPVTKSMNTGTNTVTINTNNLAAGMYYLNITTEAGSIQQKFTKQ